MPPDEDIIRRIRAYQRFLDALGPEGRTDFVDSARRNEDWPEPRDRYLAGHANKHGSGRRAVEYAQWAYDIKNRPGVRVYAYIHTVHRDRSLAFIDLTKDTVVLVDCDANLNRDCMSPSNGTTRAIEEWTKRGTHWRLRDTER